MIFLTPALLFEQKKYINDLGVDGGGVTAQVISGVHRTKRWREPLPSVEAGAGWGGEVLRSVVASARVPAGVAWHAR